MGIILGALAGMGKAAGEIADARIKSWDAEALERMRSELEIQKAQTIATFGEGVAQRKSEREWREEQVRAPLKREIAAADQKSKLMTELDPEVQGAKTDAAVEQYNATAGAKLDFATDNQDALADVTRSQAEAKETDAQKEARRAQAARAARGGTQYGQERLTINNGLASLDTEMKQLRQLQADWLRAKPDEMLDPERLPDWQKRFDKLESDMAAVNQLRRQKQQQLDKLINMDGPLDSPSSRGIIGGARTAPTAGGARPITREEYDKLSSGATFMAPDGVMRRKP